MSLILSESESTTAENLPGETLPENECEESVSAATASDSVEGEAAPAPDLPPTPEVKIRIKYLDDSQREVRARLSDKLGGFKRLHFAGDMSDDRTIRLIFNGHVLNADSQTLEQGRFQIELLLRIKSGIMIKYGLVCITNHRYWLFVHRCNNSYSYCRQKPRSKLISILAFDI